MTGKKRLFFPVALAIALGLGVAIVVSFWLGSLRTGWQETPWRTLNNPADAARVLQADLDRETTANPTIPGQLLYVWAPSLGLDQTFASGPDLRTNDDVRVASNTKTFVSAIALKLVEAGKLDLEGPIGPALSPKVKAMMVKNGYRVDTITLRQLLNHTSGVPDYMSVPVFRILALGPTAYGLSPHWTAETEIWFAVTFGPQGQVGENFVYSDTNYLIVADMIKQAVGAPTIGVAARQMLNWKKLGADETYWEAMEPAPAGTRRVAQYRGMIKDSDLDVSFDQYGGGGLVMSMDDLGRATRAVVRGDVFANPIATRTLMQVSGPDGAGGGYALGIQPLMLHGEVCWGHGGFWGTSAFHCPRLDITVTRSTGQNRAFPSSAEGISPLSSLIQFAQAAERVGAKEAKD